MKSKTILISFLIIISSCNRKNETIQKSNNQISKSTKVILKDTLVVENNALIVFVSPNNAEIQDLKNKHGEEDFYIIADDVSGYLANSTEKLDNKKIKYLNTTSDVIYFKENNIYVNKSDLDTKWGIVYFDKNKELKKIAPVDFNIDDIPFKSDKINLSEWLGNYDYSINISKIDEISGASIGYNVNIKNDSITFSGSGYQTNFYYLCNILKNKDTLFFSYIKTIEGDTYKNDKKFPILTMYRTKENKFYGNSKLITEENARNIKNSYIEFDKR